MTAAAVEPDTIAHLDWQPPCESTDCDHQHPPATHARHSTFCPCRPVLLLCDHCTKELLDIIRTYPHHRLLHCGACNTVRVVVLADVFTLRPLDPR